MKTKLQNLFMAALTLAASTQKLGVNLIRVAILVLSLIHISEPTRPY